MENLNEKNSLPVDRQINKIIAIAKYKFWWGRKAIFNYCIKTVPGCDERVSEKERMRYSTSALFQKLTKAEKSLIIQRLEQIEKRNIIARADARAVGDSCHEDI